MMTHHIRSVALLAGLLAWTASTATAGEAPESDIAQAQAQRIEDAEVLGAEAGAATSDEAFPWEGERFYYSLRVNGAEAMRAVLQTGQRRHSDSGPYVAAGLDVRSVGFFDSIYSVDHRADTYFHPRSLLPYRSEKTFSEQGKSRTYRVDYDHGGYIAQCRFAKRGQERDYQWRIPGTTHDMISWLYDLRSRPLAMGDSYVFYVYDGWKISEVHVDVVGKEDLYTPAGWFKSWKLKFVRKIVHPKKPPSASGEDGGFEPVMDVRETSRHSGHFWLSRDANHLPLRMTMRAGFGYGEAVLVKYRNHGPETASR
jgi:hypothetical protein